MGLQVFRQIGCPHRAILDPEAGALLDLVCGHARRAELREDQRAVVDEVPQSGNLRTMYQLVGAEGSFTAAHHTLTPWVSRTRM